MEFTKLHLLVLAALASLGSCALGMQPQLSPLPPPLRAPSGPYLSRVALPLTLKLPGTGPMTKTPSTTAVILNNLNQTVNKVFADGNSTGSCALNCSFAIGQKDPVLYNWVEVSYMSTHTAAILSYMINTDAGTTSQTLWTNTTTPPGVSPPQVDSNGFRFEDVSMPGGPLRVIYPTSVIDWGSTYLWSGVLLTRATPGATDTCVTQTADVTVTLGSTRQPTAGIPAPTDTKGLHSALVAAKDPTLRKRFASLFPDDAAFDVCTIIPDPPQPSQPTAVAWVTATVTRTLGNSDLPHTGTVNPGSSIAGPAPNIPEETESAKPVQGGQVVQSGWPADHPAKPLSSQFNVPAEAEPRTSSC